MSRYNAEFPFSIAFPPQAMTNVLAEWLAKEGATQAHIAGEYFFLLFSFFLHFVILSPTPMQKPRSTRMLRSSSTAASRNSSRKRRGI